MKKIADLFAEEFVVGGAGGGTLGRGLVRPGLVYVSGMAG